MRKETNIEQELVTPVRYKGNKVITRIFYTFYVLMILLICGATFFARNFLLDWLTRFEAAQPTVKSAEVFEEHFAQPDWLALYEKAQLTDTAYEGSEAFNAYMTALVGDNELTYAETSAGLSGDHKYLIRVNDKTIGYFTLTNMADQEEPIPDWQLSDLQLYVNRKHSVTVQMLDGHTAYVNGQALDATKTIQTISTVAEQYLPDGTSGVRLLRQQVTDLLVAPEVTILDENGAPCEFYYDEEAGMYTEVLPEPEEIPAELAERAIKAGEAYSYFMVNRYTSLFRDYFATGTQTYRNIMSMDRWQQPSTAAAITGQAVSDYVRYTENLYSVRVKMTMELTRNNKSVKEYPMDTTMFLENRKDGWMVIAMTNVDVTEQTSQVRLTFMMDDTQLSTGLYADDATNAFSPAITAPEGQVFSGWAKKDVAEDGTITMTLVYTCDNAFRLVLPEGEKLEPNVLYPIFEDAPTDAEEIEEIDPETAYADIEAVG